MSKSLSDKKDDNKKGAKKGDKKVLIPTRSVDGTFVLGGRQISLHPAVPQDQVRPLPSRIYKEKGKER